MKTAALAATLAGVVALAGCSGDPQAGGMTSFSAAAQPQSQAELFTVPADQLAHVQVVAVAASPFTRTLRLTGTVAYDGFLTTPVVTQVGGPVSRVVAMPGDQVRQGQPLLYVASPDFSMLRTSYLKARDAFRLADKAYTRAQDLYAHGAIAQAELEQAESGRAQAQADVDASEQALRVVGIASPATLVDNPPAADIPVLAPRAGEVVERLCAQGQLLQAGATQCFTLSDMSRVWVLVNVYQNDIGYVHVGDPVAISNETYAGDRIQGRISYVAPALDPTTRTLQARIEAANPGERLKKDMYVTAEVQAGVVSDALMVPDAAILRDAENMPYVYLQASQGRFARRSVTVGDTQGGRTHVRTGLRAGDRIVGDGSLFLQFQNALQR